MWAHAPFLLFISNLIESIKCGKIYVWQLHIYAIHSMLECKYFVVFNVFMCQYIYEEKKRNANREDTLS